MGQLNKDLTGGEELAPIQSIARVRFGRLEDGIPASATLCLELPASYEPFPSDPKSTSLQYEIFVEEFLSIKAANQGDGTTKEQETNIESGTRFAVKMLVPSYASK
jgi:hypothetical protein